MKQEIKEPADLGMKVGTKLEVLWTRIKTESLALIEQSENNLIIQREVVAVAERIIAEEKAKS